jgi:hypothetical protein
MRFLRLTGINISLRRLFRFLHYITKAGDCQHAASEFAKKRDKTAIFAAKTRNNTHYMALCEKKYADGAICRTAIARKFTAANDSRYIIFSLKKAQKPADCRLRQAFCTK